MNSFVKSHGLGNDYIIVDPSRLSFKLTPNNIRLICHRNRGVGSDGILALVKSKVADFGLRIYNPDGSQAEKSGNGIRIFSKFLFDHGHTDKTSFSMETLGGMVRCSLTLKDKQVEEIAVEMGRPTFKSKEIPVSGREREVVGERLPVEGQDFLITAVSLGNPHCVIFVDQLDKEQLRKYGPKIENHPSFPHRINVQFARVISRKEVSILIWERGAGETLASGSSACAVASACLKNNFTENKLKVKMPGGILLIEIDEDWNILMKGPASETCSGTFSQDLIRHLDMEESHVRGN